MRGSSRSSKAHKTNTKKKNGTNDAAVEGVFRIVIQRSLKEMVDLPEIKVWSMLPRTIQAKMVVRIRRYGFFFAHDSDVVPMRCVLTRRNYLIIYAKEQQLKGYAVKLSLAEKINFICCRTDKARCNVTIKWRFGEILLSMLKEHIAEWRPRILEAFEGISSATTPEQNLLGRAVGIQTTTLPSFMADNRARSHFPTEATTPPLTKCRSSTSLRSNKSIDKAVVANLPKRLSGSQKAVSPQGLNEELGNDDSHSHFPTEPTTPPLTKCRSSASLGSDKSIDKTVADPPPKRLSGSQKAVSPQGLNEELGNDDFEPKPPMTFPLRSLRRSVSTPALNLSKLKKNDKIIIAAAPFIGPRKLVLPKRSIGRIDRPLASPPPPSSDEWYTSVKRYGYIGDTIPAMPYHSPADGSNSENVQRARDLFSQRIANNQLKMQENNNLKTKQELITTWLSKGTKKEEAENESTVGKSSNLRFFESDA